MALQIKIITDYFFGNGKTIVLFYIPSRYIITDYGETLEEIHSQLIITKTKLSHECHQLLRKVENKAALCLVEGEFYTRKLGDDFLDLNRVNDICLTLKTIFTLCMEEFQVLKRYG